MEQEERLEFLIKELYKNSQMPQEMKADRTTDKKTEKEERRNLLRALMNIRMPDPLSKQLLKIQDEFLQQEVLEKGIVGLKDIKTIQEQYHSHVEFADKFSLWQGDITRLQVGAIVNAANSQMLGCFIPCHRCIDNAIHSMAGMELREACYQYMLEKRKKSPHYVEATGSAMITAAYNLPCEYVIHTVGPIVPCELTEKLRKELGSCYEACLIKAIENNVKSIAFCCISTGEFHFPNEEAAKIAVDTVTEFLRKHKDKIDRVIFNVFKDHDLEIYKELLTK